LQQTNLKVVLNALTLIEACVKNCHMEFHKQVATEKFMAIMAKLAQSGADRRGREILEICEKAADLIQAWGEAFLPHRRECPFFVSVYHDLKSKGVHFGDQMDESRAPVFTPPPVIPDDPDPLPVAAPAPAHVPGDDMGAASATRASGNDMCLQVGSVVEMLTQMVQASDSAAEIRSNELLQELAAQCKSLQPQMISLVETTMMSGIEEDLMNVMKVNEDLCTCISMYETACVDGPPSKHVGNANAIHEADPAPAAGTCC
jgi:hypothetical protein